MNSGSMTSVLNVAWSWIKGLLGGVLTNIAAFFAGFTYGAEREKRKQAEREKDEAIEQAEDLANRPRTHADFIERLRTWRDKL